MTSQVLILGQMPADARPETHLPAGQWCFLGVEAEFPDWGARFAFPSSPYSSAFSCEREGYRATAWGVRQLAEVAKEQDPEGILPLSTWEFVLGRWSVFSAHAIHNAAIQLQHLIALYGKLQLTVPVLEAGRPRQWQDFRQQSYDFVSPSGFNWLCSRLLESMPVPPSWELLPATEIPSSPSPFQWAESSTTAREPRSPLYEAVRTVLWPIRKTRAVLRRGVSLSRDGYDLLLSSIPVPRCLLASQYETLRLGFSLLLNRQMADNTRALCEEFPEPEGESLPTYYGSLLRSMVPTSWQGLPEKIKKKRSVFRTFVTDHTYFPTDAAVVRLAGYKWGGTRIVTTQHAPAYLWFLRSSAQRAEALQHVFIPWGNTSLPGRMTSPCPNLRYFRMMGTHCRQNDNLLYVMDIERPMSMDIETVYRTDVIEGRRRHTVFVDSLAERVRDHLVLRTYPSSPACFDGTAWARKHFPFTHFLRGDLLGAMKQCKLLVASYMGSVQTQALFMNTPTIWLWDPAELPMTEEAWGLLEQMREVGLCCSDPSAAARHIGLIWNDVDAWWNQPKVQAVRQRLLELELGIHNQYPLACWCKTFGVYNQHIEFVETGHMAV